MRWSPLNRSKDAASRGHYAHCRLDLRDLPRANDQPARASLLFAFCFFILPRFWDAGNDREWQSQEVQKSSQHRFNCYDAIECTDSSMTRSVCKHHSALHFTHCTPRTLLLIFKSIQQPKPNACTLLFLFTARCTLVSRHKAQSYLTLRTRRPIMCHVPINGSLLALSLPGTDRRGQLNRTKGKRAMSHPFFKCLIRSAFVRCSCPNTRVQCTRCSVNNFRILRLVQRITCSVRNYKALLIWRRVLKLPIQSLWIFLTLCSFISLVTLELTNFCRVSHPCSRDSCILRSNFQIPPTNLFLHIIDIVGIFKLCHSIKSISTVPHKLNPAIPQQIIIHASLMITFFYTAVQLKIIKDWKCLLFIYWTSVNEL